MEKIRDKIKDKPAKERATIKGVEIAEVFKTKKGKKYKRDKKTGLWK